MLTVTTYSEKRRSVYKDFIGDRIANYLKNSNYDIKLATCTGYRTDEPVTYPFWDCIGILKNDAIKKWWGGKTRRTFLGVFWISDKNKFANPDSELVFELRDEDNLEFMKCICKDIIDRFKIPIRIDVPYKLYYQTKEAKYGDASL